MTVKTILNKVHPIKGFVYRDVRMVGEEIEVRIEAHGQSDGRCAVCLRARPGYDRLKERRWEFVPLYLIGVKLIYAPRRVACPEHGVVVESMPWNEGKSPVSQAMMKFLGSWARVLPWKEVARRFGSSWDAVCRSVEWMVDWGLGKRDLCGIKAIGIDEIHWGRGKKADNFLTVIYQIDAGMRRLLWVGKRRSQKSLRAGLESLGPSVVRGLEYVCSDMWKPYLAEVARQAGQALHILDRFHICAHLNKAVDEVRRGESSRMKKGEGKMLKKMRWPLLKKYSRVRGHAKKRLDLLLNSKLQTARAWRLKDGFEAFWKYSCPHWAGAFLDYWCSLAMRSRIEPIKRVARMLRTHEALILNWFKAKKEFSSGAVEGLNNKIRVITRRSYGFRTYRVMELALYHTLGKLPEPKFTHEFF